MTEEAGLCHPQAECLLQLFLLNKTWIKTQQLKNPVLANVSPMPVQSKVLQIQVKTAVKTSGFKISKTFLGRALSSGRARAEGGLE